MNENAEIISEQNLEDSDKVLADDNQVSSSKIINNIELFNNDETEKTCVKSDN